MVGQTEDIFGKRKAPSINVFSDNSLGEIFEVDIKMLEDFPNHPFIVNPNDDDMQRLLVSMQEAGYNISPILVRSLGKGRYQIISGHRRKKAAEILKFEKLRCIEVDCSDDEATILMVDSNIQRTLLSHSEKTRAYKMKYDAIKSQGKRTDLGDEGKYSSSQVISRETGDSARQVERYLTLSKLDNGLLELIDEKKIPFVAGLAIATQLNRDEQQILLDKLDGKKLSIKMAEDIADKKKRRVRITPELIEEIISPSENQDKKSKPKTIEEEDIIKPTNDAQYIQIRYDDVREYLDLSIQPESAGDYIVRQLEEYKRNYIPIGKLGEFVEGIDYSPEIISDILYSMIVGKKETLESCEEFIAKEELLSDNMELNEFSTPVGYSDPVYLLENKPLNIDAWNLRDNYTETQINQLLEGFLCDHSEYESLFLSEITPDLLAAFTQWCINTLDGYIEKANKIFNCLNEAGNDTEVHSTYISKIKKDRNTLKLIYSEILKSAQDDNMDMLKKYFELTKEKLIKLLITNRELYHLERKKLK